MNILAIFVLLLVFGALGVVAFSIGLVWLLMGESREEARPPERRPLSLSQAFARELEGRRLWRAISSWMSSKPLRLEDRRDGPAE
jgi:hypothetical protein